MGLRRATRPTWASSVRAKFFERLDDLAILFRVTRTRADVREAERLQKLANRALVVLDPGALGDQRLEVNPPPAHHAMDRTVGTGLDDGGQLGLVRRGQPTWPRPREIVLQAFRAVVVEAMDPIPHRLAVHPADPGRFHAVHPVQHRRQRQKPPALVRVPRGHRQPPQSILP